MTKKEFINRVLLIMNEAGMTDIQGNSFIGADSAQVDRYIEGSFENAWRLLAATPSLPKSWLTNKSFKQYPLIPNLNDGTGMIVLPADFYLLTKFNMLGWQKHIDEASVGNDRVNSIQSNRYTRGSVIRPVGVIDTVVLPEVKATSIVQTVLDTSNGYGLLEGEILYVSEENEKIINFADQSLGSDWRGTYKVGNTYLQGAVVYHFGGIYEANAVTTQIPGESGSADWDQLPSVSNEDGSWFDVSTPLLNKLYVSGYKVYSIPSDVTPGSISQVMKYYALPTSYESHTVTEAIYVPNVRPLNEADEDDVIEINQRIIEPLAYITAGAVYTIFQKDQLAASLTEKGLLMIPGYRSVRGTNVTIKQ